MLFTALGFVLVLSTEFCLFVVLAVFVHCPWDCSSSIDGCKEIVCVCVCGGGGGGAVIALGFY